MNRTELYPWRWCRKLTECRQPRSCAKGAKSVEYSQKCALSDSDNQLAVLEVIKKQIVKPQLKIIPY